MEELIVSLTRTHRNIYKILKDFTLRFTRNISKTLLNIKNFFYKLILLGIISNATNSVSKDFVTMFTLVNKVSP